MNEPTYEDILKRLDAMAQAQAKRFDHIDGMLLAHSKSISALQTDVDALPTQEGLEALMRKYLRPGENDE